MGWLRVSKPMRMRHRVGAAARGCTSSGFTAYSHTREDALRIVPERRDTDTAEHLHAHVAPCAHKVDAAAHGGIPRPISNAARTAALLAPTGDENAMVIILTPLGLPARAAAARTQRRRNLSDRPEPGLRSIRRDRALESRRERDAFINTARSIPRDLTVVWAGDNVAASKTCFQIPIRRSQERRQETRTFLVGMACHPTAWVLGASALDRYHRRRQFG